MRNAEAAAWSRGQASRGNPGLLEYEDEEVVSAVLALAAVEPAEEGLVL